MPTFPATGAAPYGPPLKTYIDAARGQVLSTLPSPWFCGHRGGRLLGPEHTMELYQMCADGGYAIEAFDVRTLGDGMLVGLHDSTADRTMTITGDVSTISTPKWLQAKVRANSIPGGAGGWVDCNPVIITQVASAFSSGPYLVPNPVSVAQVNQLIDIFIRYGITSDRVIIACGAGSLTLADAVVARGWTASQDTDAATALAHGIQWITNDVNTVAQATLDANRAAGLKNMLYSAIRRSEVSAFTNVDAWYSDDPWYCSGDTRWERKTDPFALQTWVPGMIPTDSSWTALGTATRGKFYSPSAWGMDISGASINTVGNFYLAPTNTSSYTFDFTLQIDAINASDATRGAYIYLGKTDKRFFDQSPVSFDGPDGYLMWARQDGSVNFYRKDYTTGHISTTLLASPSIGTALTLGSPFTFRITVSATQVTLARTGTGAGTPQVVTDSTYRGLRYISLGQVGAGVRFSGMTVS